MIKKVKLPKQTVKQYLNNIEVFDVNGELPSRHEEELYLLMAAAMYGKDVEGIYRTTDMDNTNWKDIIFLNIPGSFSFYVEDSRITF